jgi:hypothetical protein
MARSAAALRLRRDLDAELLANGLAVGEDLQWSAAELAVLELISNHVDRREELQAAYDESDQVRVRIALATEIRLLEAGVARLLRQVATDVPAPMSVVSLKAQKASNARWDRVRAARGGA